MKRSMTQAVIVAVARTPVGKFRQALASLDAPRLAALAMRKVAEKARVDPASVDEVVFANLFDYDWGNIARIAALEAGFPVSVPALSLNRQCASSLNAVTDAACLIMTGNADLALAGGVESYSTQPFLLKRPEAAYPGALEFLSYKVSSEKLGDPPMIITAENLAKRYGITREDCDEFALESHRKAAAAWARGFYDDEVFPVEVPQRKGPPLVVSRDECVREDASLEALAKLRPALVADGVVTAGNASPMNDGASAVLLASAEKARELGLEPLARVAAFASAGVDPNIMGIGPVHSTRKLMERSGLRIEDFDVVELNEAFAAQAIACCRELGIDRDKLNPNGGAIAIGHPNAASGGILTARTVRHMRERNLKRGLIAFCCGGGQGFSCLLERD